MYEYFQGKLVKITPTYIVVDVANIGYLINVANPYAWSHMMNQEITIYVHQVIREDAHSLYGFMDDAGPKSALAIIAADDNVGLVHAIDNSDIKYLTKFPGVGKKTAMQMVLDLAGKFDATASAEMVKTTAKNENLALIEAIEALQALGYKATELKKIQKKLEVETGLTSEEYIKAALKLMMK